MGKRSREESEIASPEAEHELKQASARLGIVLNPISNDSDTKYVHIDTESGEDHPAVVVMRCSLPPHRQTISFTSFDEYDVHYKKAHVNRCIECRKNFPTPYFLNLHQEENHDPLMEVLRARGERTYSCFVEDCDRKCSTAQKRRMHLVDKHMFPKDYDFYVVNDGIDQRNSMLRSGRHRRRSSAMQHTSEIDDRARRRTSVISQMQGEMTDEVVNDPTLENGDSDKNKPESKSAAHLELESDHHMDGLAGAMSALTFVPTSVRFGRGRGRGGFSRD